jgi:hypothetical protein
VVYWCNSYTIVHFSLDIIEWFKYKLEFFFKLYLIPIHPPLSINTSDLEMGKYYFNNNFNGEIRSGPNPKIRKVGPSDLEYVFKEATWRV